MIEIKRERIDALLCEFGDAARSKYVTSQQRASRVWKLLQSDLTIPTRQALWMAWGRVAREGPDELDELVKRLREGLLDPEFSGDKV